NKAFDEHAREMEQRGQLLGDFLSNVFRDFAQTGKVDLKSLVISFAESIAEMEIRAGASWLFSSGGQIGGAGAGAGRDGDRSGGGGVALALAPAPLALDRAAVAS